MENLIQRFECIECGHPVPDASGHVHVQERDGAVDAYTPSQTRRVTYVNLNAVLDALEGRGYRDPIGHDATDYIGWLFAGWPEPQEQ